MKNICKKYKLDPQTFEAFVKVSIKDLDLKEKINVLNPEYLKVKKYIDAVKDLLLNGDISNGSN